MFDCGAFQGHREEAERKNHNWDFYAKEVSSIHLTHAHCGLLPMKGFNGNVYATPATRNLANLIMMDSAHIQALETCPESL